MPMVGRVNEGYHTTTRVTTKGATKRRQGGIFGASSQKVDEFNAGIGKGMKDIPPHGKRHVCDVLLMVEIEPVRDISTSLLQRKEACQSL